MSPPGPDPVAAPHGSSGRDGRNGRDGGPAAEPSIYNVANLLTLIRILLVPVFVWLLFRDGAGWQFAALAVFAVASVTDKIDGDLARKHGIVTDFGKIADPIADKALTGAALISLSILGELWWWVTIVILVREVGITLMRLVVIRRSVIPASKGGKLKTMLQVVGIALYIVPGPLDPLRWTVMGAATIVTVVTGLDYVIQAWRLRRRKPS